MERMKMIVCFAINIILLIINIIFGIITERKFDEAEYKEKKSKERTEQCVKDLKHVRKAYEDIIEEFQPLKDEQKNCKRGEWCKTCSFCKKVIIPIYSPFDDVTTIEVCTKGICKEYAQIQGDK